MLKQRFEWKLTTPDDAVVQAVSGELSVPIPVARAIANRGISSAASASAYASPTPSLIHDPFLLNGMEQAVERTARAVKAGERILVLGDYDVDGISGATLLVSFLRSEGANVNYYIPDRESEGYGLNEAVVRKSATAGYSLIITVDSGVTAVEEAGLAKSLGVDLVIIDHHQPHDVLPDALAVINPKLEGSTYPFRDLAGVGVAFKFVSAFASRKGVTIDELLDRYSELVALGTVADLVGLHDENRVFVKRGLSSMSSSSNKGIRALIDVSRYREEDAVDTYLVSFGLAPRINAAGRVWNPRAGVELLLTDSASRAAQIAGKLDEYNKARITEESGIFKNAEKALRDHPLTRDDRAIVLFNEHWNVGIIGIVASRLIEKHYLPAILITLSHKPGDRDAATPEKGRVCQGSVRSIPEVDIYGALTKCQDTLISFGGHRMAAGIKIYENDIPVLRQRLNEHISLASDVHRHQPSLTIDDVIDVSTVDMQLLKHCQIMEPCGSGNPRPLFMAKGVIPQDINACGADGKHLRMRFASDGFSIDAIGFGFGTYWPPHNFNGEAIDIVFTVKEDNFRNRRTVKLHLSDLRTAQP